MNEPFSKRLHRLRKGRKLSQTDVADAVGVHYNQIGRLERGSNMPSLTVVCDLARYFNITVDELLYGAKPLPENTEAAKPKPSRIEDTEQWQRRISQINGLPEKDHQVVAELIDAFVMKQQLTQMLKSRD